MNRRTNPRDVGRFADIHEIWKAIEKEHKTFPQKYSARKKAKEE